MNIMNKMKTNIILLFILLISLYGYSSENLKIVSPNLTPHQLLDKEYKLEIMQEFPVSEKDLNKIDYQGCSWYCCGNTINAKASSSLITTKNGKTYSPEKVCDLKLNTAWVEGKNDYGIGESIEFDAIHYPFHNIEIYNGFSKSLKAWKENSRVKTIKLYVNNNPQYILELKDTYQLQSFRIDTLNNNNETVRLKFEIIDIYPGEKYKDTAITEINLNYDQHCH
jgi:hypothetical protein